MTVRRFFVHRFSRQKAHHSSNILHYEKFADGTVKCIEDEIPFELPEGWAWARIGSVAMVKGGKRVPKGMTFSSAPTQHAYVRVTDMKNHTVNLSDLKYIDETVFAEIKNYTIAKNDLYITIAGTIGAVGEFPDELDGMNLTENAVKVTAIALNKTFLCLMMQTEYVQKQFKHKTYQVAMPKLGLERILTTLIPICSLSTQNKICKAVNDASVYIDIISENYQGLSDTITTTKSKILDLAIRGKLVPQDPADEPASVLLERIRTEKEELIRQGKIKRDKKESVIFKGEDNSYYVRAGEQVEDIAAWELDSLPESWGICALGEICDYGSCINVETDHISDDEWILDLEDIEKDSGKVLCKVRKLERNAVSTKHKFSEGQVLYSKLRPYLNKVVLADEDGYCTSEILPLDFSDIIIPAYARYYLMSPTFLKYADRCSYGVKMPRLSTTDGKKAVFTVPPVNEQFRIVEAIENTFAHLDAIAESLS